MCLTELLFLWESGTFGAVFQLPSETNELEPGWEARSVCRPDVLLSLLLVFVVFVVIVSVVVVDCILSLFLCMSCLITRALNARADACTSLPTGNVMAWKMSLAFCLRKKLVAYIA